MNQEQTINHLNAIVKVTIAPSKIEGVGVFALCDIPKGTKLEADIFPKIFHIPVGSLNKLFPYVRKQLLERWPDIINNKPFMYPDTRIQAFLNHSDSPNYNPLNDTVLEDIKEGEEITEDYRLIKNYKEVFPWIVDNSIDKRKKVI